MAPYFAERAAKNAAQEAADNAHEWLQQQLAHEEEEKEERRVLSIEAMADEETMSTYDEVLFLVDGH